MMRTTRLDLLGCRLLLLLLLLLLLQIVQEKALPRAPAFFHLHLLPLSYLSRHSLQLEADEDEVQLQPKLKKVQHYFYYAGSPPPKL